MTDELLTPRQVAELLGVTPRTVQRWIADGRLLGTRIGRRMRVARAALASVSDEPMAAPPGAGPRRIGALLIANRGEIAVRVARSARRLGIRAIGIHAPDDRPPDGMDLVLPVPAYLDADSILEVARRSGADAIHPGYGFLSENPAFARAVLGAGLAWVGPPPGAISAMGDKAAARRTAAGLGVPVLPGYDGDDQSDDRLLAEARRVGLPLLVKPRGGGGGKGMRVVRDAALLPEALAAARREASRSFADDRLILERLLERPRHVEIQVLIDQQGGAVHLGERDCSAQRRNQKIVEESPGPAVDDALRSRMGDAALRVALAAGYVGAGTVEFLLGDDGAFHFLEMNTRLQVEHPVTEAVTGRDLVADQLRIAAGDPLGFTQAAVQLQGHAFEARLYAEDPDAGFLPATGRIVELAWPSDVRVDTGIQVGDIVSDRYDPMLAKLIVAGPDRTTALARLREALAQTRVLGVRTNLRFLRWLAAQPVMADGEVRTDTIDSLELPQPEPPSDGAWLAAANALAPAAREAQWGGGWRLNASPRLRLVHGDEERTVQLARSADASLVARRDADDAFVDVAGQSLEFRVARAPTVEEAVRHAAGAAGSHAALSAPMPGRVLAVRVREGASVQAHETVVVVEAMKMEHAVVSPLAGTVTRLHVSEGQQVARGELLAEVSA
ncbi:MAG TPA: biotin carboxylase N-terminal domain-containing protein [Candidatus Limnocylindria bacterium]|nr:biotin carboxylase N-terminal domain-containing protein [Candidatus Limnocylindria bacterium]